MRTYTKVEDWLAQRTDLSALEKLIIAKIMRYGKRGCFQGYGSLAKNLGVDRRHLIRTVKELIHKGWLAPLYEGKYKRILYVTEEILAEKEPDLFSSSDNTPLVTKVAPSSGRLPLPHSYIEEEERNKIQEEIKFLSDVMKEGAKPLSEAEFERRRQEQLKRLMGKL